MSSSRAMKSSAAASAPVPEYSNPIRSESRLSRKNMGTGGFRLSVASQGPVEDVRLGDDVVGVPGERADIERLRQHVFAGRYPLHVVLGEERHHQLGHRPFTGPHSLWPPSKKTLGRIESSDDLLVGVDHLAESGLG